MQKCQNDIKLEAQSCTTIMQYALSVIPVCDTKERDMYGTNCLQSQQAKRESDELWP